MSDQLNHRVPSQSRLIAYYSEQETAAYCRLELQVVRQLTAAGVINGVQVVGEEQCYYAAADLSLLRRARRLSQDLGVNLEGIEIILRLAAHIDRLQQEVAQYQRMAEKAAEGQKRSNDTLDQLGTKEHEL
jgi:DNA-binding transcriptional MerR regulator